MKLLTKENLRQLPPLYFQDGLKGDAIAYVKFFTPDSSWTWFALEFDGEDQFFGYVKGLENEYGYFSLSELKSARGPLGLNIERDRWFKPTKMSKIAPELFE